jgi:chromosome segregation ATPase
MSRTTEEYTRIVTEYKNYDVDGLRRELQDNLNSEINTLNRNQDTHKGETGKKVDGYERLQREHKDLQRENNEGHENRKAILAHIQDENTKFDTHAKQATDEKATLRGDLANKEHPLRQLQDQVAVLGLDNKNLQLVIDTEAALREAKAHSETNAVRSVNTDLKDQVNRIETDILDERNKKNEAKRILDELTLQHKKADKEFEDLIKEAKNRNDTVKKDLENIKKTLGDKRSTNQQLKGKVDENDGSIQKFREEIQQLNTDINSLREKSEQNIHTLEHEREKNERVVNDLRNKLSDADHDHSKLKILIEKTRNEIEYLNSEKSKHQSQNYQKRIDDFLKNITDSETKSQGLSEELSRLNAEWQDRLYKTTRETEEIIRSNENEDHVKKIEHLLGELEKKNSELEELKNRRNEIERQLSSESSDSKDARVQQLRSELDEVNRKLQDALGEKNKLYDELVVNTRELLAINDTVQRNAQEIARLTQELSILRRELEQKEKIIYDLRILLEQKRGEIEELEATLREREAEAERLRALIAEKDAQIRDLEAQVEAANARPPTPEPVAKVVQETAIEVTDDVDAMLAQYINIAGCPVPIKRLGGGFYYFGTKKIFAKIMHGKLVIRVGGGYMAIEEFIKTYAEAELMKVNARRANGLDIFTGKAVGLDDSSKSPKGTRSPKGRTTKGTRSPGGSKYIDGTDAPTQLTAEDIKKYKG